MTSHSRIATSSYTYGVAGIGLTASLCLDGSAGITNGLSITSASGGIPEFADLPVTDSSKRR